MSIQFVYFDVGNVLVTFEDGWLAFCRKKNISDEAREIIDSIWKKYTDTMCLSLEIVPQVKQEMKQKTQGLLDAQVIDEFDFVNSTVGHWSANKRMHHIATQVAHTTPVGLLSNAYLGMIELAIKQGKVPDISYQAIIDSSQTGFIKPDERIYALATAKAGVNKEAIFFIDDTRVNIEAAAAFGFQTFLYDYTQPDHNHHVCKLLGVTL